MKLLEKVNILGRTFTIEYFDFDKVLAVNDYCGNVVNRTQKIQIDTNVHIDLEKETLLHEIIHAISSTLLIGLSEDQAKKNKRWSLPSIQG